MSWSREGAFHMGDLFPVLRGAKDGQSVLLAPAVSSVTLFRKLCRTKWHALGWHVLFPFRGKHKGTLGLKLDLKDPVLASMSRTMLHPTQAQVLLDSLGSVHRAGEKFRFYRIGICRDSFFFFSRATPMAYGSSQARSRIGTTPASPSRSHSNTRSKLLL